MYIHYMLDVCSSQGEGGAGRCPQEQNTETETPENLSRGQRFGKFKSQKRRRVLCVDKNPGKESVCCVCGWDVMGLQMVARILDKKAR